MDIYIQHDTQLTYFWQRNTLNLKQSVIESVPAHSRTCNQGTKFMTMKHAHRGVTWCMYHTTQMIQARIKKLTYLNCLLFLLSFLLLSFQHFIKLLLMSSVHLSSDSVSFLQAQQSQQTKSANITTSLQRYQLTAYIQTLLVVLKVK